MSEPEIHDGVLWLDVCESTNREALRRLELIDVRAVAAHQQTHGRGRRGREWLSPPGSGLYLSWIARPSFGARRGGVLPLLAAVATAEYCERLGVRPTVKWPNDLLVGARKLGGILCEAQVTLDAWCAVVGVGLNLRIPSGGWPDGVPGVALEELVESVPSPRAAAGFLVDRLERWLELMAAQGTQRILDAWLAWAPPPGTWMRRRRPGLPDIEGRFAGLGPDGALLLEARGGTIEVHAGDVDFSDRED